LTHVAGGARLVKELGEFSLIGGVTNLIESSRVRSSGLELGAGDDAALWRPRPGRLAVVSTDMLVESVHFRHPWSDAASVGHRALAVNLSDMAAMGARPRLALIALGLRGDETDRWVYDLYRGAMALAQNWQTRIAGGDIVRVPSDAGTTISVTVLGEVQPTRVMRRDAAQAGDILAVTGPLGLAAGGVRALQAEQTKLDGAPVMLAAHKRPQPRILHGLLLARAGVRAAMDLSDGLLGDLPKLCAASQVSAELEFDQLPIPNALRWNFRQDYKDLVLRGGEDFELLFSAPPDVFLRAVQLCLRCRLPLPIAIGRLTEATTEQPTITMRWTDRRREVLEQGAFDHFAQLSASA
jgi:thiamine-monophosphate kinase